MKKVFTLFSLLLCVFSSAWADEETISLTSYTVTNGVATLESQSGDVTVILSRNGGNADGPASNSRGFRWQKTRVITVNVASGLKINSVKLTSNSNGNSLDDIQYTLTDGTNALSGSWDYAFTAGKKEAYTWTAGSGTYYSSWVLTNSGTNGDIYVASITVNYETASVTNAAPSIATQPASELDAYVGFESSLSVVATGYPAPTYQWYQNTAASNVGGTAISGATNATYTFTPETVGTFYYYVVATNNFNNEDHTATSNVATVIVGTKYSVNFDAGNSGATVSVTPAEVYYPGGTEITLPTNHYFYLEGNSVKKWSDGTTDYDLGGTYTINSNVTFYPVFASNAKELGGEETTISWTFSRDAGAPKYAIEGDGKTATVIGTTASGIDLAMDVALSVNPENSSQYGKFNNGSYNDRAQVNAYTSFTIPAVKGMTVTYVGTSGSAALADAVTFGGEQATSVSGSTYTYEYTGEDATLTIADLQGGRYPSGVNVQYPYTGIPGPADPENTILVATISHDTGTIDSNKWTMTDNNNYTFSASSLSWKSGTTDFKIAKGGTYTIGVPSDVTVTRIDINGYSSNTAQGTTITLGNENHLYKTAEVYSFTPSHSAGADIVFTTSNDKEMEISYIKLYSADGLTLTTTATMQGWRAFYDANNSYSVDKNTKVYVATEVKTEENVSKVKLTKIEAVPAGMAVLLKTTNQETTSTDGHYSMTLTKETEVQTPDIINLLKPASETNLNQVYRLGSKNGEVGFFPYTPEEAKPNVVVLNYDASNATGGDARGLTLSFADDETTAISNVNDNVNLNKVVFDLQGRRVAKPTKGMYLVNGKKVVIK